jgi:hypothetical protein
VEDHLGAIDASFGKLLQDAGGEMEAGRRRRDAARLARIDGLIALQV